MPSEPILKIVARDRIWYKRNSMGFHYMRKEGKWYRFHSMGGMEEIPKPTIDLKDYDCRSF